MYKNILIATDGSEFARRVIDQGLELAKALNAHVTAVKVTEPWVEVLSGEAVLVHPEEEYQAEMTTRAAHALGVVAERAATLGVHCDTIHVRDQNPAGGVLAAAKDRGCDLIMMASHGRRGLQRLMFGSQLGCSQYNASRPGLSLNVDVGRLLPAFVTVDLSSTGLAICEQWANL